MLGRLFEVVVAALHPGVAPEEVAAGLGAQDAPVSLLEVAVEIGGARADPEGVPPGHVDGLAQLRDPGEGLLLGRGAGPLDEAGAVMGAGVPGAGPDRDPAVRAVAVQVVADEHRADPLGLAVAHPLHQVAVLDDLNDETVSFLRENKITP